MAMLATGSPPPSTPATPAGGAPPTPASQPVDYTAYAAHYDRENSVLREQLWDLRQMLEAKEAQAAHNSHLLGMAMREGDAIAARVAALFMQHPHLASQAFSLAPPTVAPSSTSQAAAQCPVSPAHAGEAAPALSQDPGHAVPATPSRTVLSLQHVTPGPSAGNYVAGSQVQGAPTASPCPSPSPSPSGAAPRAGVPTPRRALLPAFAPPSHQAPGSLSPEPAKKPPEGDAMAQTPELPAAESVAAPGLVSPPR